ncbi:MAG TPA: hypothetical protein P5246_08645, partial [Candidatus Omnitrophota bacterium]|nr:hypothetical protein [Candidatus Omnitrophota bacterium]
VYLTQDATPANDQWLGELVRSIESTPGAAGAYSRWLCRPEGHILEKIWINKIFPGSPRIQKMTPGTHDLTKNQNRELIFFSNVSACIRKDAWKNIHFCDDAGFAEDQLWAKQVTRAGYSIIYAASSEIYHSHHDSWRICAKRSFESGIAFGRMSEARKAPAPISFSEIFHSFVNEGRERGRGVFGICALFAEAACRHVIGEVFGLAGFYFGMILRVFKK